MKTLYHIWAQRYDGTENGRWACITPKSTKISAQNLADELNRSKIHTYEVREYPEKQP